MSIPPMPTGGTEVTEAIRPVRVNHLNAVVRDFDGGVARLRELFAADFLMDLPQAEWHACLVDVGRTIVELFVPPAFLLNARHGAHYLGIEYQADMAVVRRVLAEQGIRIVRDIGAALHTDPRDTIGVSFEFYGGSFHDNHWPLLGGPMRSARWWREEHPLGLTGLRRYTVAVRDPDAAGAFLGRFFGVSPSYAEDRPIIAATATGFEVGDAGIELLGPSGDGALSRHLERHGDGIRSAVFGVRDLDRARRHFEGMGIGIIGGPLPDSFALAPDETLDLLFEFIAG